MKIPSLLMSVLFVVALAAVNAAISYFTPGGPGAEYLYSAIIVAVLAAVGRYLQEKQKESETTTVTTADGTVMRSRAVAAPVEVKSPVNEALMG
jgi:membrane protein implicated in regulation of membrane protease activity